MSIDAICVTAHKCGVVVLYDGEGLTLAQSPKPPRPVKRATLPPAPPEPPTVAEPAPEPEPPAVEPPRELLPPEPVPRRETPADRMRRMQRLRKSAP